MKNAYFAILCSVALWGLSYSAPALAQSSDGWQSVIPYLAKADPAAGQDFAKHACAICHNFEKNTPDKQGPSLYGVLGSPVTYRGEFHYSDGMKAIGTDKWTYESLDHFLFKPQKYVHGTRMFFPGVQDTKKRADLIAYLRTLSDKPLPLPDPDSTKTDKK